MNNGYASERKRRNCLISPVRDESLVDGTQIFLTFMASDDSSLCCVIYLKRFRKGIFKVSSWFSQFLFIEKLSSIQKPGEDVKVKDGKCLCTHSRDLNKKGVEGAARCYEFIYFRALCKKRFIWISYFNDNTVKANQFNGWEAKAFILRHRSVGSFYASHLNFIIIQKQFFILKRGRTQRKVESRK